jgi:hypothetical protein
LAFGIVKRFLRFFNFISVFETVFEFFKGFALWLTEFFSFGVSSAAVLPISGMKKTGS